MSNLLNMKLTSILRVRVYNYHIVACAILAQQVRVVEMFAHKKD